VVKIRSEVPQIVTKDLIDVPKEEGEEEASQRSEVEIPNLTAGIEVLDVVQGTSDGGHDRETVDGLKEDWVFDEEIDADGEEGVEEEAQRQGQVGRPRRLTIFKQRVDEEARPEYHWKLICDLHPVTKRHVKKPGPDANEQDRELQPKIASFQPLLPRLIRKNQWRNDHDDVTNRIPKLGDVGSDDVVFLAPINECRRLPPKPRPLL